MPRRGRRFGRAAHVVRFETWVHRVTGVPMEPRAAVVSGIPRVAATPSMRAPAVSGARRPAWPEPSASRRAGCADGATSREFRHAQQLLSEFALVAWAARRVGRPVQVDE